MKTLLLLFALSFCVCVNAPCQVVELFAGEKDTLLYSFCPLNEIQRDTLPKKSLKKCYDQIIINGRVWVVSERRSDYSYVTKNQATFEVWTFATQDEKKSYEKSVQWVKIYGTVMVFEDRAILLFNGNDDIFTFI